MIKPFSPSVSLVLFVRAVSSLLPRARFRGQKSALRSERRPLNEREPPPREFPPILSRTPLSFSTTALFLLHLVVVFFFFFFLFFSSTTSSSSSSSYGGDGGFQRDVLAAANSMRDESSTVTDTGGQRSTAGAVLQSYRTQSMDNEMAHASYMHIYICTKYTHARTGTHTHAHTHTIGIYLYIRWLSIYRRTLLTVFAQHARASIYHPLCPSLHHGALLSRTVHVISVGRAVDDVPRRARQHEPPLPLPPPPPRPRPPPPRRRYWRRRRSLSGRRAAAPRAPTTTRMSAMIRPTSGEILSHHWSATTSSTAGIVRPTIYSSARRDAMAYRSRRRRRRRRRRWRR